MKSLKLLPKAGELSLQQNKPETKKSIKSKLEIVAKSLTFDSTTTRNKSIQSKLEILFAKGKLELCFDNTTTRSMKSIKLKHEIVAKKFKLQFLFQQHNYLKHEINQIKA